MARSARRVPQGHLQPLRAAQAPRVPRPAEPARLAAARRRLEAAARLEADHPRRHEGPARALPLLPAVHGHLRPLRGVRRQVPLLPRLGRSEEHAGAARRADPLGLPPLLHARRPAVRRAGGRARPDRGRAQGVVLLLLPVHRVPPLLGLLPVRHRHGRDHDDRPRAAEPGRLQHPLDRRARGQLRPRRQPPRHPAARLQGQPRVRRRRTGGTDRHPRRGADQQEGRRGAARRAVGRLLRLAALLHAARLPHGPARGGRRLHVQRLRVGRRQLRPLLVEGARQAPEREDLRRGEAPRREVDSRAASAATCGASCTSTWTR